MAVVAVVTSLPAAMAAHRPAAGLQHASDSTLLMSRSTAARAGSGGDGTTMLTLHWCRCHHYSDRCYRLYKKTIAGLRLSISFSPRASLLRPFTRCTVSARRLGGALSKAPRPGYRRQPLPSHHRQSSHPAEAVFSDRRAPGRLCRSCAGGRGADDHRRS